MIYQLEREKISMAHKKAYQVRYSPLLDVKGRFSCFGRSSLLYIARPIDEVFRLNNAGAGCRSPVYPALNGAHTILGWTGIGYHSPHSRDGWVPSVVYFALELDFDDLSPLLKRRNTMSIELKNIENGSETKNTTVRNTMKTYSVVDVGPND